MSLPMFRDRYVQQLERDVEVLRRDVAICERRVADAEACAHREVLARNVAEALQQAYESKCTELQAAKESYARRECDMRDALEGATRRINYLDGKIQRQRERHDKRLTHLREVYDTLIAATLEVNKKYTPTSIPSLRRTQPQSNDEWFLKYESIWKRITSGTFDKPLTFLDIPWPMLQCALKVSDLNEKDIETFFSKKYPGSLGSAWKEELLRWHPDRFPRLVGCINDDCMDEIWEGLNICIKTMTQFQRDRNRAAQSSAVVRWDSGRT